MTIAIVTQTYPPKSLSGTAQTMESLAGRLVSAGHDVWIMLVRGAVGRGHPQDGGVGQGGERVIEVATPRLGRTLAEIAPARILATSRRAPQVLAEGEVLERHEVVLYLQDAFSEFTAASASTYTGVVFASSFLRDFYYKRFGIGGEVLPPLVDRHPYSHVASSRTHGLSFGLSRVKRPDIVFHAARKLPKIPFEIFHTWGNKYRLRNLHLLLRRNIALREPIRAPQEVYAHGRVLLVPSDTEGWCRVVTEGQFAGIPTIARSVAALPESVGGGGCLLPRDASREAWVTAIRRVFQDEVYYLELIQAAIEAGQRPMVSPERIAERWLALLCR